MSKLTFTAIVLALCMAQQVVAAESGSNKGQASRMSQCSAEAKGKGLKGDARKEHMSVCLRNPAAQAGAKECNDTAAEKGLKGDRRKEFLKECLKTKAGGNVG
jgi:hypothetical protein